VPRPTLPIETDRLTLRAFTAEDLDDLYAYHSLPEVARFVYWEARTRDGAREALAEKVRQVALDKEGDALTLAVVLRDEGTVIGDVNLRWLSEHHRQGEIGFVFNPTYQGQGYATEAAREVLRLGFAVLGLHRIMGRCDALNVASARLMERLGMRREAHFIENEIFKGTFGDEFVYAMLAREFAALNT
jgi:RimJ/RimL family protein N-acetyltransferase